MKDIFMEKILYLSTEINKEEYFIFDKKKKKCNIYFSKEEIENIVGNIHLEKCLSLSNEKNK